MKSQRVEKNVFPLPALITIVCVICCPTISAQSRPFPTPGTLVVIVPTRDGIVIGADRRTNDEVRGDLDTTLKIRKLGQFTSATATGNPTWDDRATLRTMYDVRDIAETFFRDRDLSGSLSELWRPLAVSLVEEFKLYLANYPFSQWPVAHDTPDNALFQLEVVHYNQQDKQFSLNNIVVLYRPQLGSPWMEVTNSEASPDQLRDSEPMTFGNRAAYLELKDGHDKRFDRWRKNKNIKKLLSQHIPASRVSKQDALEFCRELIHASAEILPLIDVSPNHVGFQIDVAMVSTRGFIWILRDAQQEKLANPGSAAKDPRRDYPFLTQ
jgi:hypothetical protein